MIPLVGVVVHVGTAVLAAEGYRVEGIHLRDPYLLADPPSKSYYLFGTGWPLAEPGPGFVAYQSKDLRRWHGPVVVFRRSDDFWADRDYWAPEVHRYRDRYYLFGSFKAEGHRRGTQILVADSPLGPYRPLTDGPVTPSDWECLDGTLYVDRSGRPWIVFCHEWVQTVDGEICAMPLSDDLREAVGEPVLLFRASEAPWIRDFTHNSHSGLVTDGPFPYTASDGTLWMLWSSFSDTGYTVGLARSETGAVTGPWEQLPDPLFADHGGHAMVFRSFAGIPYVILHQPNSGGPPVPTIFRLVERAGELVLEPPRRLLGR